MFRRYLYRNYRSFASVKYRFGRRITPAGWMVIAGIFVTAALGVDTSRTVAYQTFTFLFWLAIIGLLGARWNRARLSVQRVLPKFGSVGEPFNYRLIVQNKSRRTQRSLKLIEEVPDPRPTFDEFVNTPEPGEEKRNWFDRYYGYYRWTWLLDQNTRAQFAETALPDLPPKAGREVTAQVTPLRRGFLRLTGATVASPDPFGLFRSLRKVPAPQSVLILPKRYIVPPFQLPGTTKYQQGGVSLASSIGESEEFASLRDYRPGDPLRRIHWKSFAKAGRPVVKEYQDEFFVRHAMILDTFSPLVHSEVFEEAVSVAASLAYTIQNQDSLLDLMFVGPQAFCFTTGRGVAHVEQMLEILASVQPCRDKEFSTLENLVWRHANDLSGCICIFLQWDEERKRLVESLKLRGIPLLVFIVTNGETNLEPGPMADNPSRFRVLPHHKIGEELAKL